MKPSKSHRILWHRKLEYLNVTIIYKFFKDPGKQYARISI